MSMSENRWLHDLPYDFPHRGERNMEAFLKFVDNYAIETYYTGIPLWPKMLPNKFQKIVELTEVEDVPYSLSYEMYIRWDGSRVFVAHISNDDYLDWVIQDITKFAEFRGMKVDFLPFGDSWYNNGVSRTVLMEVYDLKRYTEYIEEFRTYDQKKNRHYI